MKDDFERGKSIQELELHDWGEPNFDSSLVTTVHRLRRKPVAEFTVEDFRILIGQKIGLPFLIPLAVERLEKEPFAEGDFYRGELLQSVSRVGDDFWADYPDLFQRFRIVVGQVKELLPSLEEFDRLTLLEVLAAVPCSLTE